MAFVAAIVVSFILASSYDPLEQGSTAIGLGAKTYRDGATDSFAFSIRNGGRWGVTIVDLPILNDEPFYSLLDVTRAEMSDAPGTAGPFMDFRPFSLGPSEERLIRLSGTFTDCEWYATGSTNDFPVISVRYRFLGLTDTADVPLFSAVSVESPPDTGCPRSRRVQQGEPIRSPNPSG